MLTLTSIELNDTMIEKLKIKYCIEKVSDHTIKMESLKQYNEIDKYLDIIKANSVIK